MSTLKLHTIESAPAESKPLLEKSEKAFGMLPNLHAVMAESPALLEAYQTVHHLFSQFTVFNAEELTVVWQTINVENNCHYCVPAHTGIAHMMKVDSSITDALRNQEQLQNPKLQALHEMTLLVVRNRGIVANNELDAFFEVGYTNRHLLEIILGYSQKILSNYTNHIADTPVDEPFKKFAWKKNLSI